MDRNTVAAGSVYIDTGSENDGCFGLRHPGSRSCIYTPCYSVGLYIGRLVIFLFNIIFYIYVFFSLFF